MNGCVYRTEDNKCEFYSDYGKGIVSYCDFDDCEDKKPSNADRIRAMSDDELAEFINDVWDRLLFGNDLPGMCDVCYTDTIQNCKKCWLDWLKEEVTANDS